MHSGPQGRRGVSLGVAILTLLATVGLGSGQERYEEVISVERGMKELADSLVDE